MKYVIATKDGLRFLRFYVPETSELGTTPHEVFATRFEHKHALDLARHLGPAWEAVSLENEVTIRRFPVFVQDGFEPLEIASRHDHMCPCQDASDGFRPKWGGGFTAVRAGGRQHKAIDIMAAIGCHVVAVDHGTVEPVWLYKGERRPGAGYGKVGGWYVRVRHPWGVTYYAHLHQQPLVNPGESVVAGQMLGLVGRTGNAAPGCPHLHYSMTVGGRLVDPVPYLINSYESGGWK